MDQQLRRWLMPGDHELDIVNRLPQVGEISLGRLLQADYGDRAALLAGLLERAKAFADRPQDAAVSRFSNFLTAEPG
jgi:hypothetical protein